MSNTYNQVTPIVLGQQRKSTKTNKRSVLSPDSTGPLHPSFQSAQPPLPTTSGVLLMGHTQGMPQSSGISVSSSVSVGTTSIGSDVSENSFDMYDFDGTLQMDNNRKRRKFKVKDGRSRDNNQDSGRQTKSFNGNIYTGSHALGLFGDNVDPDEEERRRRRRAERFNLNNSNATNTSTDTNTNGDYTTNINNTYDILNREDDITNLNAISSKSQYYDKNTHIVGRCQKLEKSYLRLTSEPNPDLVRPLPVLRKAFDLLMEKDERGEVTYAYLCDQLKAIRQDMRVQMIENRFTMKVYQTHARLALKHGDLGEFNQCQSRLLHLYKDTSLKKVNFDEFMSYLILYYMVTNDDAAINALRLELLTEHRNTFKHPLVATAFQLADAQLTNNYRRFMTLYSSMKGLGKCLVKTFIEREMSKALNTMCLSYNQLNLEFLAEELHFGRSDATGGVTEFLCGRGLDRYIVTKNAGQPSEFKYLDAKSCRNMAIL